MASKITSLDSFGSPTKTKKSSRSATKLKTKKSSRSGTKPKTEKNSTGTSSSKDTQSVKKSKPSKSDKKSKSSKSDKKSKTSKTLKERVKKAGSQVSHLEKQLDEAKNDPTIRESEQFQEYYEMFNSLKTIARVIEKRCKENANSKDIYALMQLYNQMREVIADIRTLRDIVGVAELIRNDVIDPLMQTAANELVQINQSMRQFIMKHLEGDIALDMVAKLNDLSANAGDVLHEAYGNSVDRTLETLEQQ